MLSQTRGSNHIYYDKHWQEPAATEKIANENVALFDLSATASIYVGFPWATYIDLFQKDQTDSEKFRELNQALIEISAYIQEKNSRRSHRIVTCCQHIWASKYIRFFEQLLITDLFWSHKKKGVDTVNGIKLAPFPLYPVNGEASNSGLGADTSDYNACRPYADQRTIICSFIGATDLPGYSSDVRSRLANQYAKKNGAFIKCRSQWHYQGEVYDKQILGKVSEDVQMRGASQEEEFKLIMSKSLFSLCPSGTGPNTIRLWESIDFMAIPIILSNRWSPPGNISLWEKACIFFDEHGDLEELWRLLVLYSKDRDFLKEKWDRLRDLGTLYNQKMLSHDLIAFLLNPCVKQYNNKPNDQPGGKDAPPCVDEDRYLPLKARFNAPITADLSLYFDADKLHRTPFGYSQLSPYINLYFGPNRPFDCSASTTALVTGMLKGKQASSIAENQESFIWHVSEEPLWDLLFNSKPELALGLQKTIERSFYSGYLSGLYDGLGIPYFLLTSSKYIQRYVVAFAQILKEHDEKSLLAHWKSARLRFLAFCEYRKDVQWRSKFGHTYSRAPRVLCAYRTVVCEELSQRSSSASVHGKGWRPGSNNRRQELPDWHVNKLTYERQSMLSLAIENVEHKNYITEKPFDALAMASIPVVFWACNSDGFKFIDDEAVLNLHGKTTKQAVDMILEFKPTHQNAKAFLESCRKLQQTFSSSSRISEARRTVARRLQHDFQALCKASRRTIDG